MNYFLPFLFVLSSPTLFPATCFCQSPVVPLRYTVPGSVYTQNFDGLPFNGSFALTGKGPFNLSLPPINGSGLTGWQLMLAGGSNAHAGFAISTGSSLGSGSYSYGNTGSTERALGSLASGTGMYALGLILTNETGMTLNTCTIRFTAEQWRKGGSTNRNTWSFRYKTGNFTHIDPTGITLYNDLDFASVLASAGAASLNGNLTENQISITHTLTGLSWKPGEQLLLRWDDADEAGSDDAMAIDQFSFHADIFTAAPTIAGIMADSITHNSAILQAMVSDNHATTTLFFEYDSSASFSSPMIVPALPAELPAGTGTERVTGLLMQLQAGRSYSFRLTASNSIGTTRTPVTHFSTRIISPAVISHTPVLVTKVAATLGGSILSEGGSAVTEKGVVWSTLPNPTLGTSKKIMGGGSSMFQEIISGLLSGTRYYARAYATNVAGTSYGNEISFTTKTMLVSLLPNVTGPVNTSTVSYTAKFDHVVTGLLATHFSLIQPPGMGASIQEMKGTGSQYILTVATGKSDGKLTMLMHSDTSLVPAIHELPFTGGSLHIDQTPPNILQVQIRDTSMKAGDMIPVRISVTPDSNRYQLVTGSIHDIPIKEFMKINDSLYMGVITILPGKADVTAAMDVSVRIQLKDPLGNVNIPYEFPIRQASDPIDANKPSIHELILPAHKTYKTNDSLHCIIRFNEKLQIDTSAGIPTLGLVIGNKNRSAVYAGHMGSDSLIFSYVIQPGEIDSDGIHFNNTLLLNGACLTDAAGNAALLGFSPASAGKEVRIDAVAPYVTTVGVPNAMTYRAGNNLDFRVQFNEPISVDTALGMPSLVLSIGGMARHALYHGSSLNELRFRYPILSGDLDKNGLNLGATISLNESIVQDLAGNEASLILKNIGALSQVKVDAVGPKFKRDSMTVMGTCQDADSLQLTEILETSDLETGEALTWTIIQEPLHGRLSGFPFMRNSNGGWVAPTGTAFEPDSAFNGTDQFIIKVSDGLNASTLPVRVMVYRTIQQNTTSPAQLICAGDSPQLLQGSTPAAGDGRYTYHWESSHTSSTSGFKKMNSTNEQRDLLPGPLTETTWFRRIVRSSNCVDTGQSLEIKVMKKGLWLGRSGSTWSSASNWCGTVIPSPEMHVLIPAGTPHAPLITDTVTCHDLRILLHASLRITGLLQIKNRLINEGMIDCLNGELSLGGDRLDTLYTMGFTDHSLKGLFIDNQEGIVLQDSLIITDRLVLHQGKLFTNNWLNLKHTAAIGASAAFTSIHGKITATHRLAGGRRAFHFLGHPFQHSIALATLRNHLDITGNGGALNGFTNTPMQEPSAFFYAGGWNAFTHTNGLNHNAWKKYQGIRLFHRGAPGQGLDGKPAGDGLHGTYLPEPVDLQLDGTVNHGDQEIQLPADTAVGFHLTANPYLSSVDLSRSTKTEGVGNAYWIWNKDQGTAGGYTSIPFKASHHMPAFGAFFVKTDSGAVNPSLFFTEQNKVDPTNAGNSIDKIQDTYQLELTLKTETVFWDRFLLVQVDSARDRKDKMDAEKFMNPEVSLYSLSWEGHPLSIDARTWYRDRKIPLGIRSDSKRHFVLKVTYLQLPKNKSFFLVDTYRNHWMKLLQDSSYAFSVTSDTSSQGEHRFYLTDTEKEPDTIPLLQDVAVRVSPVPSDDQITIEFHAQEAGSTHIRILNQQGLLFKTIPLGICKEASTTVSIAAWPRGVYFIEVRCGKSTGVQKMIRG